MTAPVLKRSLTVLSLVFVLYFTTSGGPFTTEGLVAEVGPGLALLIMLLVPLLWSVPEALIIGELASMLPEEGATIAGCGAPSAHSGPCKTGGGRGCIRWSTWPSIQSCSRST